MKKAGVVIDIADNGLIALTKIEEAIAEGKPYDLLLTDMQMPEMDGLHARKNLADASKSPAYYRDYNACDDR